MGTGLRGTGPKWDRAEAGSACRRVLFLLCAAAAGRDAPLVRRRRRHPHRSAPLLSLLCRTLFDVDHYSYSYSIIPTLIPISLPLFIFLPLRAHVPAYWRSPTAESPARARIYICRAYLFPFSAPPFPPILCPRPHSRLSRGNVKVVGACSAASVPMVRLAVLTVRSPRSPKPVSPAYLFIRALVALVSRSSHRFPFRVL